MLRLIALFLLMLIPQTAGAEEFEQSFDGWRVYCTDAAQPAAENCSVNKDVYVADGGYLVQVTIEFNGPTRLKLFLPVDSYFTGPLGDIAVNKHIGIFIDDYKGWALLPIKECTPGYCESYWIEKPYFPKKQFLIEIKTGPDEGMRISIPLKGFDEAVKALEDRANIPPPK